MSECVVVGCKRTGVGLAAKHTEWGPWEYWVCQVHRDEVDSGAEINDNPDGTTITLTAAADGPQPLAETAETADLASLPEELVAVEGNPDTAATPPTANPAVDARP